MLICFWPKDSHAMYLDSGSAKKKDYKYIRRVLDDALAGYKLEGGKIVKQKCNKSGVNVFNHVTQFACVKQPTGSVKDVFYALHHMQAFVQDQQDLTLPSHLKPWAESRERVTDANIRKEFFHIQGEMATIIFRDALVKGSTFYAGNLPSNGEIEARLKALSDTRPFMTKEGVLPFPEPSRKK